MYETWNVVRLAATEKIQGKSDKKVPKIVHKQFLEAVMLLKRYIGTHPLDIHANNVMIRRTPYGPQLVITDPYRS